MVIKDTGIGGLQSTLGELDHILGDLGFHRGAWDYNHCTYDCKLLDKGVIFYLRIQCDVVEGRIEDPDTVLKMEEPFIGKHLFPHGLDYDATIPNTLLKTVQQKLASLKEKLHH